MGVPFMLLLFPVMLLALRPFRPQLKRKMAVVQDDIAWTPNAASTIFALTALGWIFSSQLNQFLNIKDLDGIIALFALLPWAHWGWPNGREISDNTDLGHFNAVWRRHYLKRGIYQKSGTCWYLGQRRSQPAKTHRFLVVGLPWWLIVILTEFSSNTASAALLVPVFASVAAPVGMPPSHIDDDHRLRCIVGIYDAGGHPPNAIVMGSGLIRQREMMKGALCSI